MLDLRNIYHCWKSKISSGEYGNLRAVYDKYADEIKLYYKCKGDCLSDEDYDYLGRLTPYGTFAGSQIVEYDEYCDAETIMERCLNVVVGDAIGEITMMINILKILRANFKYWDDVFDAVKQSTLEKFNEEN